MEPSQPLTADDIAKANARFDREHGNVYAYEQTRIRSGWSEAKVVMRGKLTDRQIGKYAKQGRYSEPYKKALRDLMALKKSGVKPAQNVGGDKLVFSV